MRGLSTLNGSSGVIILTALFSLFTPAATVKQENFKTCSQSGFCQRNRKLADDAAAAGPAYSSPYRLDATSVKLENGQLLGSIYKTVSKQTEPVKLPLTISFLKSGVARVSIDEEKRAKGKITLLGQSNARKERYNEAANFAIVGGLDIDSNTAFDSAPGETIVSYGPDQSYKVYITHQPLGIRFVRDGETHVILNERQLLNVEHWRPKPEDKKLESAGGQQDGAESIVEKTQEELDLEKENADAIASGMWEETFGGATDSKPRGPESVALDVTFPGYEHVFGIPSHATTLSLKQTRGGEGNYNEPYRMYNADVFQYIMDSPMTLYGSIPFMQAHKKGSSVGVFWLNSAETWVDVIKQKPNVLSFGGKQTTQTHWISESGILDIFVFLGPEPSSLYRQYGELTGYTTLPQSFAIAYHQCRWNYVSQDDVKEVDKRFDKFDIPYDVIWLDIEHTDGKRYFTFDPLTFGHPKAMGQNLDKHKRKLVVIVDPHIKNADGYSVSKTLKDKSYAVKNKNGDIYEGWCWPGSSNWIDCFNPEAFAWWKSLFKLDVFKGTLENTFVWNDMNEPSVFNGPETTMPKDNLHYGGWEHRDVHNLNGMTFHNATHLGLEERLPSGKEQRSFVLTRSFFAGSQRVGAMWTGDNEGHWSHLEGAIPMLLANGIAGYPFAGADVGGFFGDPTKELLTRWYQAGAFYPFFRAHAHIDAKRREPYLTGEPYLSIIRSAIRLRYQLLPTWYTAFHRASVDGMPIIQPQFVVFPDDVKGYAIEDQFFLGDAGILVKPVVREGAASVDVYFAGDETYYDYFDYTVYKAQGYKNIAAPLEKTPVFMRGGHIFPRRDRPRRSSDLMKYDPMTLVVVLGNAGNANGTLYLDDGKSFDYKKGVYIHRLFTFDGASKKLKSTSLHANPSAAAAFVKKMKKVRIEKVIIVGMTQSKTSSKDGTISVKQGKNEWQTTIKFEGSSSGRASRAIVRDPKVAIGEDWEIIF